MTLVSQIEAILFVVGEEGIGLEELAYLLEKSTAKTYEELTKLKEHYASDNKSALNILEVGNHFVLTTKKKYASLLKKYAQSPMSNALSQAALETLSFMDYFGLKSLDELPDIQQMEDELEEELPMDLFFDRYQETNPMSETTEGEEA